MNTDVRWARYHGPQDQAEAERIRKHDLYKCGDTIIVWVNEGDIITHTNMDPVVPEKPLCGNCKRSGVKVCWDQDCDIRHRDVQT